MPKVLVVDDSLSVRKVVEKALDGLSVQVLSAASGIEAIECIERDQPDVIVCDVILPDKDGYQVCEFVRAHPTAGKTPVLLISGVVNSTVLARAAEVQSDDVMFKPFAADELVRKIDTLLNGRLSGPHAQASAVAARPVTPTGAGVEGSPDDLKGRLEVLISSPGVRFAALTDREGFLIEWAGDVAMEVEAATALAACLAGSSDGIGRQLGQGALQGMILEYERGTLLLTGVGPAALLAVLVSDPATLGKVRYCIKKLIPELQRGL